MDVAELLTEVAVTALVHNVQACNERHVGNGEVNTTVTDFGFLKALHLHLCIGIEQREDAARGVVNLNGMDA